MSPALFDDTEVSAVYDELIKWLRYCANDGTFCEAEEECPFYDFSYTGCPCMEKLMMQAADVIEKLSRVEPSE